MYSPQKTSVALSDTTSFAHWLIRKNIKAPGWKSSLGSAKVTPNTFFKLSDLKSLTGTVQLKSKWPVMTHFLPMRIMLCVMPFLSYASRNTWHKNKWSNNFWQKFLKTCPVQNQLVLCNVTSKTKEIGHCINNFKFLSKDEIVFDLVISTLFKWYFI